MRDKATIHEELNRPCLKIDGRKGREIEEQRYNTST